MVYLTLKTNPNSSSSTTVARTVSYTTTKFDTRGRGRQTNLKIESTALNADWRYGTLRLDVQPDGGR